MFNKYGRLIVGGLTLTAMTQFHPAVAADTNGQYAVKGSGTLRCTRFLDERKTASPLYQATAGWVAGYISAYNRMTPNTMDITPWQDAPLFLDLVALVCEKNTDKSVEAATYGALKSMAPLRLQRAEKLETRNFGNYPVRLYTSTWQQVEQALVKGKYLKSTGPDIATFSAALKTYQVANKMKPTGTPDQNTLYMLLMRK